MSFDVSLRVYGGGFMGQSEACMLALSKAIVDYDPKVKEELVEKGALFINRKRSERKKTGLYKARKKFPYKRR